MSLCREVLNASREVWEDYRPGYTEVEGVRAVTKGISGLAFAAVWRMRDSNDLGTGTPLATQAMQLSAAVTIIGVVKLAVPIASTTLYFTYCYLTQAALDLE